MSGVRHLHETAHVIIFKKKYFDVSVACPVSKCFVVINLPRSNGSLPSSPVGVPQGEKSPLSIC